MTQETPMTAEERARKWLIGDDPPPDGDDPYFENTLFDLTEIITEAEEAMKERCHDIAAALDSGRGNEKEIAAAIRALGES